MNDEAEAVVQPAAVKGLGVNFLVITLLCYSEQNAAATEVSHGGKVMSEKRLWFCLSS